jgi:hypothetical protein
MPENVVTAYQSVVDQYFDEDTALNNCKTSANILEKMDEEVDNACTHGKGSARFVSSKMLWTSGIAFAECLTLFSHLGGSVKEMKMNNLSVGGSHVSS